MDGGGGARATVRFLSNNKEGVFVESQFACSPGSQTLRATITRYDLPHFYIRSPPEERSATHIRDHPPSSLWPTFPSQFAFLRKLYRIPLESVCDSCRCRCTCSTTRRYESGGCGAQGSNGLEGGRSPPPRCYRNVNYSQVSLSSLIKTNETCGIPWHGGKVREAP